MDFSVAKMPRFLIIEVFSLHILKWSADETIVLKHSTAS